MSDQLRSLGDEIRARGSMLRTTGQAWLVRHFGVSAGQAKSMINDGSGKFFSAREDALFPPKENPSSCKCKKLEGVAAAPESRNPTRAKRNPAKPKTKPVVQTTHVTTTETVSVKGAAKKKAPKSKSGGRKSAPPSKQERSPMAAKKKTAKKAAKKAKKPRSAAQKAATKRMISARKSKSKARKPRKAPAKRKAAKKARARTWGEMGGFKMPKARKARKARKDHKDHKAPAKRKTAKKRSYAPRTSRASTSTTRRTSRVGNKLRTDIHTTRTTTIPKGKRNPINDVKHMTVGIISIAVGFGTAEVLDRIAVNHYPKGSDGKPIQTVDKDGKMVDVTRNVGPVALILRHQVPSFKRFAVAGGGAALLGGSAYLLRNKSAWGTTILGGLAIGFGFKLAALGVGYILPKILPVEKTNEDTWVNEIFPENHKAFDPSSSEKADETLKSVARGVNFTDGVPPWKRMRENVSAAAFGPVAGASNGPKARAPQANGGTAAGVPGNVIQLSQPAATQPSQSSTEKSVGLADLLK